MYFFFVFIRDGLAISADVLDTRDGGLDTTVLLNVDKLWITLPRRGAKGEWLSVGLLGTKRGRQDRGQDAPGKRKVRLEGFEPPPTQIRSLRLYPLSYTRSLGEQHKTARSLSATPLAPHPSRPSIPQLTTA